MRTKERMAFDVWLHHGLAEAYGDVTREKIPDELLRLLDSLPPEG